MTQQIEKRIEQMKVSAFALLIALPCLISAAITENPEMRLVFGITACFAILPFFFFAVMIPVWHWKHCYRGKHDELWGALLVLENSGWFKIIYWFRHIRPDRKRTGRYRPPIMPDEPAPPVSMM
jgi:hypothetical protein